MSGGHFGYAQYGTREAFEGRFCDAELNDLFYDLFCAPLWGSRTGGLAEALDLWQAGDIGEDTYREEVAKFKKKWFKQSRSKRLRGYVDQRCKELHDQLVTELDLEQEEES